MNTNGIEHGASPGSGPARILLAEDDVDLRGTLVTLLEAEGYDVIALGDGSTAAQYLEAMLECPHLVPLPDLVISDLQMPYIDGLDLLESWPLPGLLITSFADDVTRQRARRIGVPVLDKPFDIESFRSAVHRLLHD